VPKRAAPPRAVYVTPAHQFPLGVALSLERRLSLLAWTRENGIVLIEDDYDSEFRYFGRPIPSMKGLDGAAHVFLLGTFNKALFPALRIGFMVVPQAWMDAIVELRLRTVRFPAPAPQKTLAAFIEEGHFARHVRRMRELYGERLMALRGAVDSKLKGAMRLPEIEAGLQIPAYLADSVSAGEVGRRAKETHLDIWTVGHFAIHRSDINALLLGFGAFTAHELRSATEDLARIVESARA